MTGPATGRLAIVESRDAQVTSTGGADHGHGTHETVDEEATGPVRQRDRSRYVKVTSWDEVDEAQMRQWITQAGSTAGWT